MGSRAVIGALRDQLSPKNRVISITEQRRTCPHLAPRHASGRLPDVIVHAGKNVAYDLDTECSAGLFLPLRGALLLKALGWFLLALFPSLHAFHVGLLTLLPNPIVAPRRIQCRNRATTAGTPVPASHTVSSCVWCRRIALASIQYVTGVGTGQRRSGCGLGRGRGRIETSLAAALGPTHTRHSRLKRADVGLAVKLRAGHSRPSRPPSRHLH
jgi:hypothetical protein